MTTDLKSMVRNLANRELKQLESLVRAEIRRRKKIVLANAGWTSGEGLEPVLEASLKHNDEKWGIYVKRVDDLDCSEVFRSASFPDTYKSSMEAHAVLVDHQFTNSALYVVRKVNP